MLDGCSKKTSEAFYIPRIEMSDLALTAKSDGLTSKNSAIHYWVNYTYEP